MQGRGYSPQRISYQHSYTLLIRRNRDDIERTYDRSIERFIKTFKERGKWW